MKIGVWRVRYSAGTPKIEEVDILAHSLDDAIEYIRETRKAYFPIFHHIEELPLKVEVPEKP